jgi:hypothetical protein
LIRLSESRGANPLATVAPSGDGHHTRQEKPVARVTSISFEVSLTREEMFVIEQALDLFYNERRERFGGYLDSDDPAVIAETLREEFKKATS